MSGNPPQLGEIPKISEMKVPTLADDTAPAGTPAVKSDAAATLENAKKTVISSAQSAMDTVANHPLTQNVKDTVANGPVAQNIKEQSAKTSNEASALAATRKTPGIQAATGQPLTHYHSFFYSLLTWEHPRITAISYVAIVTAIIIARYVPLLRLTFKFLAYTLGTTALVEGVGQIAFSQSLLSAIRPRKYYTIPREALESTLEDVEQLMNFFVIETQRLVYAEDASKTFAAFLAAFIGYWFIKFTPVWGLTLIAVSTVYLVPLVYITNKEMIDEQLNNASKIVNAQTAQMREIAATHTAQATESLKGYAGDYTAKAQELIGSARRSVSPAAANKAPGGASKGYTAADFPSAPQHNAGVETVEQLEEKIVLETPVAAE